MLRLLGEGREGKYQLTQIHGYGVVVMSMKYNLTVGLILKETVLDFQKLLFGKGWFSGFIFIVSIK